MGRKVGELGGSQRALVERFPELLLHEHESPAGVIAFATNAQNRLGDGSIVNNASTAAGCRRQSHPSILLRLLGIGEG